MLGFVVGMVCLVGVVKMLRRCPGWHGGCGRYAGPPYGPFGRGPFHGFAHRRRRGFGRFFVRSLFDRLETTPGQEKAIMRALEQLTENEQALREEWVQTRADVARVVEGGLVDDAALEESFARHDRLAARVRVSMVESLKATVEALDERQRKVLASLLAGRGGWFRGASRWNGGRDEREWDTWI